MSIIINGTKKEIPGLVTKSWLDTNSGVIRTVNRKEDKNRNVLSVILHTTRGMSPGTFILDELGNPAVSNSNSSAMALVKYWSRKGINTSAHLIIAENGEVFCIADLQTDVCWHATISNAWTIGIEICQNSKGLVYKASYDSCVLLLDFLTKEFGIQRMIPAKLNKDNKKEPLLTQIPEFLQNGGKDFRGIFFHVNNTHSRGKYDPGPVIGEMLLNAGYEGFNPITNEDIEVWKERQKNLGIPNNNIDGIPGSGTRQFLKMNNYKNGLWISRPND